MINENEDKVKYYQSWYGEKCPYTFKINNNNNHNNQNNNNKQIKTKLNNNNNHNNNNNSYINEEREYTSSITKRITPQQQQSQQSQQKQQLNKHHEIILGPKKIRPNSAIQPSGLIPLSKSSISKRPNSGFKKIQKYDMTDELNEENAVLMIRAALCNIDKQTINDNDQNKIQLPIQSNTNTNSNSNTNSNTNTNSNSNSHSDNQNINNNNINNINSNQKKNNQNKTTPTNIKPSEIQSVKDVDIITQRRIVPSVEKNYLRVRPSSPIPIDKNPVVNIVQDNKQEFQLTPHPELVKRSLFVAGLRNSIKKSEEIINNSSNDEKNIGLVIENSKNTTKEKEKEIVPRLSKVRPQSANITSARRKTDLTVTEPQISPHSPHSPHRLSTRSSLSKNSTPKSTPRTTQIQTDSNNSNNNNNDTNNDNNSPKTRLMSAVGKSIQRPSQMVLEKKTPRGDGTDIEPVGEESTVEDDLSTARDEATTFPLFSIVEARYKGRSHWWTGKIVQARLDGTYDIQFGDILERHVPSSRIRVKPSVDIDKIKSKIRITGMLATTLRDTYENIQKDDTDIVTMEDEFNPVPLENIVRDSGSSPGPRSLVRKTIVRVLSGSLASGEDSNSSQQSQSQSQQKQPFPSRSSLFSQITAGATKLRKVEHQMEAAAEAVAEAKRRFEIKEQQRLWPELKKTVTKFRNEIAFEDVKVLRELGRGKFASVHIAELNVRLHTKVFSSREGVKRTLERLGNNLNKIQYGVKHLTLPCALKVLEYSDAYPLTGGDWEHDKPPEKNYNDNQVYTDENEITGGDNNIDNDEKRERSNSMADTSIDPINEYRSYQEKYKVMPPSKSILESLREIKALTLLQHKNIIMLHGVILAPRLILVLEKMQYSLADLISTHPDKLPVQLISSQKLTILHDISNGLNHIHSHNHIHRDIKIHNILVSCGGGGYVAKIADFGTALHITKARKLTEAVGTSGYTAPEVTDPGSYDISIDIFSFGILMWETIQPYENKIDNPLCGLTSEEATEKIKQGVRPPLKHCELTQIHPLIERCWATIPTKRPTSDLLYQELTNYFSCI